MVRVVQYEENCTLLLLADFQAVGGSPSEFSNLVARTGGPYGSGPQGFANNFYQVDTTHGGIAQFGIVMKILGS